MGGSQKLFEAFCEAVRYVEFGAEAARVSDAKRGFCLFRVLQGQEQGVYAQAPEGAKKNPRNVVLGHGFYVASEGSVVTMKMPGSGCLILVTPEPSGAD